MRRGGEEEIRACYAASDVPMPLSAHCGIFTSTSFGLQADGSRAGPGHRATEAGPADAGSPSQPGPRGRPGRRRHCAPLSGGAAGRSTGRIRKRRLWHVSAWQATSPGPAAPYGPTGVQRLTHNDGGNPLASIQT